MQQLDASSVVIPLEECETLLWRAVLARISTGAMSEVMGGRGTALSAKGQPGLSDGMCRGQLRPDFVLDRLWDAL
jgi:hypothetical protein